MKGATIKMGADVHTNVEPLWTSEDVSRFLSKSLSWVRHHRHLLPAPIRLGRELRWPPSEIKTWAEAQRDAHVLPFPTR